MKLQCGGVAQSETENVARFSSRSWDRRQGWREKGEGMPTDEEFDGSIQRIIDFVKGKKMHYRNGREAKNGDKVAMIGGYGDGAQIVSVGILYDAKPGNDYCNGAIAPIQGAVTGACLCDCLHLDDVAEMLKEKDLDKRPSGK